MIGRMDQRVTLQRRVETPDGGGGIEAAWSNLARHPFVFANVYTRAGREPVEEGRVNATSMVVFRIHNRSDLSEADRIVWGGVAYNIRTIRREGSQRAILVIDAERGAAN